mmetsp:Transcript_28818/g.47983  ORF Transcript_28818/g.47983 Transcript_28818/m.47983 type:complete len:281 (-) Transcript_28818:95-937(-)
MILSNALELNNKGVSLMTMNARGEGGARRNCGEEDDDDDATIQALTASLSAVQQDIRDLAGAEGQMTCCNVAMQQQQQQRHRSPIFLTHTVSDQSPTGGRLFIFTKAVEAIFCVDDTSASVKAEGMAPQRPIMDDAIACSACIIFNMALFYHLKSLRRVQAGEEDRAKAQQLYRLALQVMEPYASSLDTNNVLLLIRLASLNNLGCLKILNGELQEARSSFMGLMHLLNTVEEDLRLSPLSSSNCQFRAFLNESEWSGMTSNCLYVLFHIFVDAKTALAA